VPRVADLQTAAEHGLAELEQAPCDDAVQVERLEL
jgi:hypothetical protein